VPHSPLRPGLRSAERRNVRARGRKRLGRSPGGTRRLNSSNPLTPAGSTSRRLVRKPMATLSTFSVRARRKSQSFERCSKRKRRRVSILTDGPIGNYGR